MFIILLCFLAATISQNNNEIQSQPTSTKSAPYSKGSFRASCPPSLSRGENSSEPTKSVILGFQLVVLSQPIPTNRLSQAKIFQGELPPEPLRFPSQRGKKAYAHRADALKVLGRIGNSLELRGLKCDGSPTPPSSTLVSCCSDRLLIWQTDATSGENVDEVLMFSTTLDVTTLESNIDQIATLAKPQAKRHSRSIRHRLFP
jgi:hypothetical protein